MTGIDRIIDKINADAEAEAARILAEAEAEAGAILEDAKGQAITEAEAILKDAEAGRQTAEDRAVSNANLEVRKLRLALKQQLIGTAFDKALRQLKNLPEGRYGELLVSLAKSSATDGSEIILSRRDREKFGALIEGGLAGAGIKAKLSGDCRETGGGLIVKSGRVEINCTIDAIVASRRDELAAEVVNILF